jgi:hypothetical protein
VRLLAGKAVAPIALRPVRGASHLGEQSLIHVGELDDLHLHADAEVAELLRKALARVQRDRSEAGGRRLGTRIAPRVAGREDDAHLRAVMGEVLAQLLDVRARDLARSPHQLHGRPQVGDAPSLPGGVERSFLAPLRHPDVAHPHLLEELGAETLERARLQVGEPPAQGPHHGAPALRGELRGAHGPSDRVRSARLLEHRGSRRELHQRDPLAVHDEGWFAARFRPAAVVLEQRLHERGRVAHQRLAEEALLGARAAQLGERRSRLPLGEPLEGDLRRRGELPPLAPLLLLRLLRRRLQRLEPAPRLGVDGTRLALARPVQRFGGIFRRLQRRRDRLDDLLGRHAPLEERERPVRRDRDHPALVLALGHRREALAHGDLGILPDVAEEVVADRDLGDLAVVQGLSHAAQDLHRRIRERHVEPLQLSSGLSKLPLDRWKKRTIVGAWMMAVNESKSALRKRRMSCQAVVSAR